MAIETKPFDSADYLETEEDIAAYIGEVLAADDAELTAHALGVIARAKGLSPIAQKAGLSTESLKLVLSNERAPDIATLLRFVAALGLRLTAEGTSKAA